MPNGKIYQQSVFAKYFDADDAQALAWANNVFTKLVEQGIVPKYISRENEEDYEALYRPVAVFFSYLVRLAREIEAFKEDQFLSTQYLLNRGQFVCGDESLDELLYIIANTLREFSRRGTIESHRPSTSPSTNPHGELLRMICWDELTFFKLGLGRPHKNSWNLDNSGPLHRGCTGRYDLNIGYEYTESVIDLSKYPLINDQYISLGQYRGKNSLHIEGVPFTDISGVGLNDADKRITIDPRLNYEITFYVAQDITLENITFGCRAFDNTGTEIQLQSVVNGANEKFFFETRRLNKAGKFYFVRGIIYNKDRELMSIDEARLNIGFGRNLKFTEDVRTIIPYIVFDNNPFDDSDQESDYFDSTSTETDLGFTFDDSLDADSFSDPAYDSQPSVYLWNIKVTPCNTNYNRCFLDNKNFIDVIVNNKNGRYTNTKIDSLLRKYFIPYNTAFKSTHIGVISEVASLGSFLLLEDGNYILLESEDRILLEQQ